MPKTTVGRRGLLGGALALAGAASVLSGCAPDPPAVFDPKNWDSVRAQFAYDPAIANFSTYVFASPPASVRAAVSRHQAGFDQNPIQYLHTNELRQHSAVLEAAASYLGGKANQLCLTDSTTMGLGLVYNSLKLAPGEEILTTTHDFYATHEALRFRVLRDGASLRRVQLYADPAKASVDEIVGNLVAAIRPNTRVIALTWVHSGTGVRLPVKEITRAVAGRALVCLDSVHGFGAQDATVTDLGVDFLISGCHKWLFGPRGTGLVWGSYPAWEQTVPVIPSFDFANRTPAASPGGYKSFEYQWALAETFAFHQAIGRDRVSARTTELASRLKEALAGLGKVTLITPRSAELSAGIVCCQIDGREPGDVVNTLRQQGVQASVTPYDPPYVRFGTSIVNDENDLDRAVKAVSAL
jgi:selenocysteine lyase/cysteine desulfurase